MTLFLSVAIVGFSLGWSYSIMARVGILVVLDLDILHMWPHSLSLGLAWLHLAEVLILVVGLGFSSWCLWSWWPDGRHWPCWRLWVTLTLPMVDAVDGLCIGSLSGLFM